MAFLFSKEILASETHIDLFPKKKKIFNLYER